jgi:hypothetical protein
LSFSADIRQALRRQGQGSGLYMRSMLTNCFLPASFETRTSSIGHLVGGREVVSP